MQPYRFDPKELPDPEWDRAPLAKRRLKAPRTSSVLVAVAAVWTVGAALRPPVGDASSPVVDLDLVERTSTTLPLYVNDRVERWVEVWSDRQRPVFQRYLSRQGRFERLILGELEARGMPRELVYLAMIESGFSPRAVSGARAVGLWQFMAPTARDYGLRMDGWVDERRDPEAATRAALSYLEWLHGRYGSWYLAAAAYNAGPGRLDRVLARYAGGRTGSDEIYWEILGHLPRETRDYVPKMVAATLVGRAAGEHGFDAATASPYEYDRVFVPGGTQLRKAAAVLGVEVAVLEGLNPHLIRGVTPPDEWYGLRVPKGSSTQVATGLARQGD